MIFGQDLDSRDIRPSQNGMVPYQGDLWSGVVGVVLKQPSKAESKRHGVAWDDYQPAHAVWLENQLCLRHTFIGGAFSSSHLSYTKSPSTSPSWT